MRNELGHFSKDFILTSRPLGMLDLEACFIGSISM